MTNFLNFDTLYGKICDTLRESKKTDILLDKLKKEASTDRDRIQIILNVDPGIVELFSINIKDFYESKCADRSKEFYNLACRQNSIELLNKALLYCPANGNPENVFETSQKSCNSNSNVNKFIEYNSSISSQTKSATINLCDIYNERSRMAYGAGESESCIQDIFRSLNNGHEKTFKSTLRLGECYKNLNMLNEANGILQHSLQLLRQSSLDNELKSKETMNVIKLLKEINLMEKSCGKDIDLKREIGKIEKRQLHEGESKTLKQTSETLVLKYNEERGRHLIATKTIPPGSTLIKEIPYAWSISDKKYGEFCQFCMTWIQFGIPCKSCSTAIFCCEECCIRASVFHDLECKILKLIDCSEKLGKMAVLVFRTVTQTPLSQIKDEYSKWMLCDSSPSLETILGLDSNGILDSSNYSSVFAQTANSTNRLTGDILKRTYSALYLTICLRHVGYFKESKIPKDNSSNQNEIYLTEDEIIVAAVLLRHLQSVSCNAYGINYISKAEVMSTLEIEEIGGATYPIISTTNHNCNPNVYRFNIGKVCVVKSLREISEGEEILDSYGPQYTISPLEQRIQELENQYLFQCSCEACVNDWPSFVELKELKKSFKCQSCNLGKLEEKVGTNKRKCIQCGNTLDIKKIQKMLNISEGRYKQAKEAILHQKINAEFNVEKSVCNYISTVQKLLMNPCKEMVEAQEILKLHWNLEVKNEYIVIT